MGLVWLLPLMMMTLLPAMGVDFATLPRLTASARATVGIDTIVDNRLASGVLENNAKLWPSSGTAQLDVKVHLPSVLALSGNGTVTVVSHTLFCVPHRLAERDCESYEKHWLHRRWPTHAKCGVRTAGSGWVASTSVVDVLAHCCCGCVH